MKPNTLLACLVAAVVWAGLSVQQPAPEGVAAALGSGTLAKILAAVVPALLTYLGGSKPEWLKKLLGLLVNVNPGPTPTPGPVPVPVPTPDPPGPQPGPRPIREALLELLAAYLVERLRKGDKAAVDQATAFAAVVAQEAQ